VRRFALLGFGILFACPSSVPIVCVNDTDCPESDRCEAQRCVVGPRLTSDGGVVISDGGPSIGLNDGIPDISKSVFFYDGPAVVANGLAEARVLLVLNDGSSSPVPNVEVAIASLDGTVAVRANQRTQGRGDMLVGLTSKKSGIKVITATFASGQLRVEVPFVAGPIDLTTSSLVAPSRAGLAPNGAFQASLTLRLSDANANPIGNQPVTVVSSPVDGRVIGTLSTDASGEFVGTLECLTSGLKTISLSVAGTPFSASVNFQGGWFQRMLPMPVPLERTGHAMAYDAARKRVVLFGGLHGSASLNDTWEFDGTTWSKISVPQSPAPRSLSSLTYDPTIQRVVLFGGFSGALYLNDTWEFDGQSWVPFLTANPPARAQHATAFESILNTKRIVLFGGNDLTTSYSDAYTRVGHTWASGNDATGPAGRYQLAMSDAPVLMFGGRSSSGASPLNEFYSHGEDNSWTRVNYFGPEARVKHTLVTDTKMQKMILYGGETPNVAFSSDVWTYDLGLNASGWKLLTSPGPSGRVGHSMIYDSARFRTVVFGGNNTNQLNDTWEFVP
jgi:Invasin, domain 3/Galactose oxidase, central domain